MDPHPLLQAMQNYLNLRGKMPIIQNGGTLPGEQGAFDSAEGPNGTIFLSPKASPTTLPHELAHATHFEMARQRAQDPNSPQQFNSAWDKTFGWGGVDSAVSRLGEMESGLSPKQLAYRQKPEEAVAFGVGNQTPDAASVDWRGGGHLDTTLATEMAILLELAQRKKR